MFSLYLHGLSAGLYTIVLFFISSVTDLTNLDEIKTLMTYNYYYFGIDPIGRSVATPQLLRLSRLEIQGTI